MKKLILITITLVLAISPAGVSHAVLTTPAIYYVPHQDDETLSMAVDIAQHIDAGREVIAVLYTSGAGSAAHRMLNGEISSGWWGGYHNPATEGYAPLDDAAFTAARTNEMKCALLQLGVKPENIHIRPVDDDGAYSYNEVKNLVLEYATQYPGASHKAMSYHDSTYTHADGGRALNDLYNAGVITDARFFVSRYDWNQPRPGWIITPTTDQALRVKHAAKCYEAWNPVVNSYAVGYHSVHNQFESMLANIQNKIHRPNE
ncbi:PIG-L family deacetylase [Lihuaxuella thermophila]|uniref:GlcNAc-PI de-N-acetylase n=1 Tax=Lihuaxuella thermophila TaxID=1173111 RepID=A0A1H8JG67_9BACL|nr:PIG-L family deacetylase [Lihuaxuella thermophila]SEN79749.1 GlcNAc-PI de-N-acetylase [Lihuaxuella thermophila]